MLPESPRHTSPPSPSGAGPSHRIALEGAPPPGRALDRLEGAAGRVLLESAGEGGAFSLLAADPLLTLSFRDGAMEVLGMPPPNFGLDGADVFGALERLQAALAVEAPEEEVGSFAFSGGIVGYLGYECADLLERLPPPPGDDVGLPDAWFGVYDWAVVWERRTGECFLVWTELPGRPAGEAEDRARSAADRLFRPGGAPAGSSDRDPEGRGREPAEILSSLDRKAFMGGVERIREYIRAGDLFQANLTRRLSARSPLSGRELYGRLLRESPAPYAAYLETAEGEVASISPEGFLSVRGGKVETRPIKGTAPRSGDPGEDRRLAEGLLASGKDRAENVMIVDLLRNDLSRVCDDGSVEVPHLLALESHPTVHHLVSTVRARLRPGVGPVGLLRAAFPGGSVTGAPKIRALEVLRELEPVRRGVYTGALGILGFSGEMELSIPIRTAVCRDGWIRYGTGGGITLDSDPEGEWLETEDKARAFVRALGAPS